MTARSASSENFTENVFQHPTDGVYCIDRMTAFPTGFFAGGLFPADVGTVMGIWCFLTAKIVSAEARHFRKRFLWLFCGANAGQSVLVRAGYSLRSITMYLPFSTERN